MKEYNFLAMSTDAAVTHIVVLIVSALGLLGNALVVLVLSYQIFKKGIRVRYYFLLIGLSISDILLLLLSILRTLIALRWVTVDLRESPVFEIVFAWDWISTGGTKYYTVAISLERYWVICFPLQARRYANYTKRFALAVLIFVVSLTIISYVYDYLDPTSFQVYAAVVLHFFPFAVLLVFNFVTYLGFRTFKRQRDTMTESESSEEIRVTRMLLTVVLVFGICYSFEFIRRLMAYARYFDFSRFDYYDYLIDKLADIFFVLNSSVNFIIYCVMGATFRKHFVELFCTSSK